MVKEKKLATLPSYQKKGFTFFAFENEAETLIDQFKDNIIDQYERKGFFEDMNYEHDVCSKLQEYIKKHTLKLCCIKSKNDRILFVFNADAKSILLVCNCRLKLGANAGHLRMKRQELFENLFIANNTINQRLIHFVTESNTLLKQEKISVEKQSFFNNIDHSIKKKLKPTEVIIQEIAESLYNLSQDDSDRVSYDQIKKYCINLIRKFQFIKFNISKKEIKFTTFKDANYALDTIFTFDGKHTNIENYKTILHDVAESIFVDPNHERYIKGLLFFKTTFIKNKLDTDTYVNDLRLCDRQEQVLCCNQLLEKNSEHHLTVIYHHLDQLVDQSMEIKESQILNEQINKLLRAIKDTEYSKRILDKLFSTGNDFAFFQQLLLDVNLDSILRNYLLGLTIEQLSYFIKQQFSHVSTQLISFLIKEKKELISIMVNASVEYDLEILLTVFESNICPQMRTLYAIMIIQNDSSLEESILDQLNDIYPHIRHHHDFIDLISINDEIKKIFSSFEIDRIDKIQSLEITTYPKSTRNNKSSAIRQELKSIDDVVAGYGRWGGLARHILSTETNVNYGKLPVIKTRHLIPYINRNQNSMFITTNNNLVESAHLVYCHLFEIQRENNFLKHFYKIFDSEKLTPIEFMDIFYYIFDEQSRYKEIKLNNLKFWETFFSKLLKFFPNNDQRKELLSFSDDELLFIRGVCKYNKKLRNLYGELFDESYNFSKILLKDLELITISYIPNIEFHKCYYYLSNIVNMYLESEEYINLTKDIFNKNDFHTQDFLIVEPLKVFKQKCSKHKIIMFLNSRFMSNLIYPFPDIQLSYMINKSLIVNIIFFVFSQLSTQKHTNLQIPYIKLSIDSDVIIPEENTVRYLSDLIRVIIGFSLLNLKFNCLYQKFLVLFDLKGIEAMSLFREYSNETKIIFEKIFMTHDVFASLRETMNKNFDEYSDESLSKLHKVLDLKNKDSKEIDCSVVRHFNKDKEALENIADIMNFDYIVKTLLSINPDKRKMLLFNVMNQPPTEPLFFTDSFASVFSDLVGEVEKEKSYERFHELNQGFFNVTIKREGINTTIKASQDTSFINKLDDDDLNMSKILREHYPKLYCERFF